MANLESRSRRNLRHPPRFEWQADFGRARCSASRNGPAGLAGAVSCPGRLAAGLDDPALLPKRAESVWDQRNSSWNRAAAGRALSNKSFCHRRKCSSVHPEFRFHSCRTNARHYRPQEGFRTNRFGWPYDRVESQLAKTNGKRSSPLDVSTLHSHRVSRYSAPQIPNR